MNAPVPSEPTGALVPAELYRKATDIASLCRDIVTKTAVSIQDRNYVKVEGWQAIATAHGCAAGARNVERVEGGYRCVGEVRMISTGIVIAEAEGFVGEDEVTWFGGKAMVWDKIQKKKVEKVLPKRDDYAIRAMCQTRAISRVCRSAFAHVVVLMDAGLSTTPAEEVPMGGFDDRQDGHVAPMKAAEPVKPFEASKWREFVFPDYIKKHAGVKLGATDQENLIYWANNYEPKGFRGQPPSQNDINFRAALDAAMDELGFVRK